MIVNVTLENPGFGQKSRHVPQNRSWPPAKRLLRRYETARRMGRLPFAHDEGTGPEGEAPCLPRHLLRVITREVMDQTSARDYFAVHADHPQNRWRLPA